MTLWTFHNDNIHFNLAMNKQYKFRNHVYYWCTSTYLILRINVDSAVPTFNHIKKGLCCNFFFYEVNKGPFKNRLAF